METTLHCPYCKKKMFFRIGRANGDRQSGYASARATVLKKMETYCTPEAHKARAQEMRYCNLCKRKLV